MAYTPANLSMWGDLIGGGTGSSARRYWTYNSPADPVTTVDNTDYFSNASAAGMKEGDVVFVFDTDSDPPDMSICYVSEIDSDGNGTVTSMAQSIASVTTLSATNFTATSATVTGATLTSATITGAQITAMTGTSGVFTSATVNTSAMIASAAAGLVGFYGRAGVSQRASSVQATSNIASSTDFAAAQLLVVQEIMNTLTGVGLWKGTA